MQEKDKHQRFIHPLYLVFFPMMAQKGPKNLDDDDDDDDDNNNNNTCKLCAFCWIDTSHCLMHRKYGKH